MRTDLAKALFASWQATHVRFDSHDVFGKRITLYSDGPYIQALLKKEADGNPVAAHVLSIGRSWNAHLRAKIVDDLCEWFAPRGAVDTSLSNEELALGPAAALLEREADPSTAALRNMLRILREILRDPLQGCTADMFVAIPILEYCTRTPVIRNSFRFVPSPDEEATLGGVFGEDARRQLAHHFDAVREINRRAMEEYIAEIVRTEGANLPAEVPILKK